jgi:hypothetical protein
MNKTQIATDEIKLMTEVAKKQLVKIDKLLSFKEKQGKTDGNVYLNGLKQKELLLELINLDWSEMNVKNITETNILNSNLVHRNPKMLINDCRAYLGAN